MYTLAPPDHDDVGVFIWLMTCVGMQPRVMEEVLEFIEAKFGFEDDAEITMEANPTVHFWTPSLHPADFFHADFFSKSVEVNKLRDFRKAGINRLSIGVQSLNSKDLKYLGRAHSPEVWMARLCFSWTDFSMRILQSPEGSAPGD